MKIEKLNDHQIRCTLTNEDLATRHINLSELAYGTEKTRALFQDMMTQASIDFGFEAEDIPLMIEAIPLSPEKIVLIITKVDSPDELDTRFSSFTHLDEMPEDFFTDDDVPYVPDTGSDLTELLNEIKQAQQRDDVPSSAAQSAPEETDQIRRFTFTDLLTGIEASALISGEFRGSSSLYRNPSDGTYHLFLHQGSHTPAQYNRVIHILSAYLKKVPCTQVSEAYCQEHFRHVIADHAIRLLAEIS